MNGYTERYINGKMMERPAGNGGMRLVLQARGYERLLAPVRRLTEDDPAEMMSLDELDELIETQYRSEAKDEILDSSAQDASSSLLAGSAHNMTEGISTHHDGVVNEDVDHMVPDNLMKPGAGRWRTQHDAGSNDVHFSLSASSMPRLSSILTDVIHTKLYNTAQEELESQQSGTGIDVSHKGHVSSAAATRDNNANVDAKSSNGVEVAGLMDMPSENGTAEVTEETDAAVRYDSMSNAGPEDVIMADAVTLDNGINDITATKTTNNESSDEREMLVIAAQSTEKTAKSITVNRTKTKRHNVGSRELNNLDYGDGLLRTVVSNRNMARRMRSSTPRTARETTPARGRGTVPKRGTNGLSSASSKKPAVIAKTAASSRPQRRATPH